MLLLKLDHFTLAWCATCATCERNTDPVEEHLQEKDNHKCGTDTNIISRGYWTIVPVKERIDPPTSPVYI